VAIISTPQGVMTGPEARRRNVGGEVLSHAHGFPLRLVAPERRGFQWIKWLATIEVV
jgi:hypothetical protein